MFKKILEFFRRPEKKEKKKNLPPCLIKLSLSKGGVLKLDTRCELGQEKKFAYLIYCLTNEEFIIPILEKLKGQTTNPDEVESFNRINQELLALFDAQEAEENDDERPEISPGDVFGKLEGDNNREQF